MVVLAGNGDGGGGSGGSGNGGKGKKGAGTGKDEKDPNGDGKDGKCGGSGPSKCEQHEGAAAGDPVEVSSGRVYTQLFIDVAWPGPLPFSFRRKYSSNLHDRDVGLGFGWTHSMAWELLVRGRVVQVWDEDGADTEYPLPVGGYSTRAKDGSLLFRDGDDFVVVQSGGLRRRFEPTDATRKRFRMKSFGDTRNNTIHLEYDANGRLAQITDCVGRVLRVRTNEQGRIVALEAPTRSMGLITFAQYRYDANGDLVSHTDAEGHTARFSYVLDHLMSSQTQPGAWTFHYRWDAQRRCVETWGGNDNGAVPALSADSPKFLADGRTRAKGMLHARIEFYPDGYREVIDSMTVRRFFVGDDGQMTRVATPGGVVERSYDEDGNMTRFVDQLGNETRWAYDGNGNVLAITDPAGNITEYVRDAEGREIEVKDTLGTIAKIVYDTHGNATEVTLSLGDTAFIRHDSRGLPIDIVRPDGSRIVQEWDAHGNRVRVVQPDGSTWQWTYDELGNQMSATDPTGATTRTRYNLLRQPIEHMNANGRIVRFDYSPAGERIYVGDGKHAIRAEYDGHLLMRRVFADGTSLQYRYNRECFLTEVINEKGEVHRVRPSEDGFPVETVTFDGRRERYKYDPMNRIVEYENGAGQKTLYSRDAMGQIVAVEYPDGSKEEFEYDVRGRLVRAANDAVRLEYRVNDAGMVLREDQIVGDDAQFVEREFNITRERVATKTSRGHAATFDRSIVQEVAAITLDGAARVAFERDARGSERKRLLPGGAVVTSEYDPTGMLLKRALYSPHVRQPYVGADEPEWVGARDPAAVILKAFRFDHFDTVARFDTGRGETQFENDVRGRIASVLRGNQTVEAYSHDEANNLYEVGERRVYDKGNVLREKGNAQYFWNENGQLAEKRIVDEKGTPRSYRYEWSRQLLSRVTTPDGLLVEFDYDPFARRMAKRVFRETDDGEITLVSKTRYVWDGPRIVHEIREVAREQGDAVIEERTFAWADDRGWKPLGQRDTSSNDVGPSNGQWLFFVEDYFGTPEQIVTGDGKVVGEIDRSVYGKTRQTTGEATTSIRLPGQWEDEETGLFYNRYRYYDPDIGRYISPDEDGEMADDNLYRYTTNPLHGFDLEGLHEADWQWYPKGKKSPTQKGNGVDSSFDDDSKAAISKDIKKKYPGDNGKQCLSAFNSDRTSDTEAKITRDKLGNVPKKEQGGHLDIQGQLPPCKKCHKKMQDWADKNKSTVNYSWPKPGNANTVTFSPNKPPKGTGPDPKVQTVLNRTFP